MASDRHRHPDYAPPSGDDWQAWREGRRRRARDEAIAQWERISPEFARRRAVRAAAVDVAGGDDEAGGRT